MHGFINAMEARHDHGGLYSNCSAGWSSYATTTPTPYAVWVADLSSPGHSVIGTSCISNTAYWSQGQRTRPWLFGTTRSYGGAWMNIDDDCAYTGKVDYSFNPNQAC